MASTPEDDSPPTLTLLQKVKLIPVVAGLPFALAIGAFRNNKGRSWPLALSIAGLRYLLNFKWDIYTLRGFMGTTTTSVYEAWAKKSKQEILTDVIAEGAKLHWIGPRRKDRVVLYFHGGGFSLFAGPDHPAFLEGLQKSVAGSVGDVGIALLQYSLTPDHPFPIQLRQANAALAHLIADGVAPSNIILMGDSAGGNLALQVSSHILHPLSSILPPPTLSSPLAGIVLISPWVKFDTSKSSSFTRNDKKDFLGGTGIIFLAGLVQPGVTPELLNYVEPASAPAEWWDGLDKVAPRILNLAGEHETLFDSIVEFGEVLKAHVKDAVTVVEPAGVHEDMIVAFGAGDGGRGADYRELVKWVSESYAPAS